LFGRRDSARIRARRADALRPVTRPLPNELLERVEFVHVHKSFTWHSNREVPQVDPKNDLHSDPQDELQNHLGNSSDSRNKDPYLIDLSNPPPPNTNSYKRNTEKTLELRKYDPGTEGTIADSDTPTLQLAPILNEDTLLVDRWNAKLDLVLTNDGLFSETTDDTSRQIRLENSTVDDLLSDTTANLPNRPNPFEKFSETSLKVLASNPRTPARILSWLATHFNPEVRTLVARNRSALPETIWLLAKDYDEAVRLAIAEHLEADRGVLKALCQDTSPLVAWRAKNTLYLLKAGARTGNNMEALPQPPLTDTHHRMQNPFRNLGPSENEESDEELAFLKVIAQKSTTPPSRLAELSRHANKEIRAIVAENANATLETLWNLSKDSVAEVKLKLTENYNCPIEIIEALQDDKDSYVAWQARNILLKLMGESYGDIALPEEQINPRLVHSR